MHEHNDCKHVLKYCKHCDVVYCEKCGSEWRKSSWFSTPYTVTYLTGANTTSISHTHEEKVEA
jgi:hypothetical protein